MVGGGAAAGFWMYPPLAAAILGGAALAIYFQGRNGRSHEGTRHTLAPDTGRGLPIALIQETFDDLLGEAIDIGDAIVADSEAAVLTASEAACEIQTGLEDQLGIIQNLLDVLQETNPSDAEALQLVELVSSAQNVGTKIQSAAGQILIELQFQDRIRQDLERLQSKTRLPIQILAELNREIEEDPIDHSLLPERLLSIREELSESSRMASTHGADAGWCEESGEFDLF